MTSFANKLRKFLVWKLDEYSKVSLKGLTRISSMLLRVEDGSFKQRQIGIFLFCLVYFPVLRLRKLLVGSSVEKDYDAISGSYIKNFKNIKRMKWGIVDGEPQLHNLAQHCDVGMKERMGIMEEHGPFSTMLEVGTGELTTYCSLIEVMKLKRPELHGIDISLNRLRHGRSFAKQKGVDVNLVKASAFSLPYPDDSFDVVFTSHCLEWMPKKMFKQAVDEICRVSKKHVFLFEPTYEHAGFLQRMKMKTGQYMKGLVPYLASKKDIEVASSYVLKNSYNPFNQTSCHHLIVESKNENEPTLVCPKCKSSLEQDENSYFCYESGLGYPIFDGIPVLDTDYALGVSRINES